METPRPAALPPAATTCYCCRCLQGKLRMLYECFPMAMLVEQAGGRATSGSKRIMEIVPDSIHGRAPIYLGSSEEVERIEQYKKEAGEV